MIGDLFSPRFRGRAISIYFMGAQSGAGARARPGRSDQRTGGLAAGHVPCWARPGSS